MSKPYVAGAAMVLMILGALPGARAATRAVTCEMSGTVEVKPGLRAPAPGYLGEPYKVKIEGELTGCESTDDSLHSGSMKAIARGEGTCVLRGVEGVTSVRWDNGNRSTFDISTNDAAVAAVIRSTTTKSNEPAMQEGDDGTAVVHFEGATEKCNTDEGITSATFEGQFSSGAAN